MMTPLGILGLNFAIFLQLLFYLLCLFVYFIVFIVLACIPVYIIMHHFEITLLNFKIC
jgi:hypothetical protein